MKSSGVFYLYFLTTNQKIARKIDYFNPIINLKTIVLLYKIVIKYTVFLLFFHTVKGSGLFLRKIYIK